MKPLSSGELLAIWERGLNRPTYRKAIDLLAEVYPDMDAAAAERLSIGERDARLLALREWLFGPHLSNMADCPQCAAPLEWESHTGDLRQPPPRQDPSGEFSLEMEEYSIRFRLPNTRDIASVISSPTAPPNPAKLLASCIIHSRFRNEPCEPGALPHTVVQAINRRMQEEDPQADIRMELRCPDCSHLWEVRFDIANYLWTEIDRWAENILSDIHTLARVYGWSEHDILDLGPVRRGLYIGMVVRERVRVAW